MILEAKVTKMNKRGKNKTKTKKYVLLTKAGYTTVCVVEYLCGIVGGIAVGRAIQESIDTKLNEDENKWYYHVGHARGRAEVITEEMLKQKSEQEETDKKED